MARVVDVIVLLVCAISFASAAHDASGRRALQRAVAAGQPGPWRDWVVAECERPCPSLFLASWGFQCALGATHCCSRRNSLCTPMDAYTSEPPPAGWTGRNLTATRLPVAAPPAANCGAASSAPPAPAACPGGGIWMNASATQYWSYPPCCTDPTADQTECVVYSGCAWEGMFAAFGDTKKPLAWVQRNNIASFFKTPNEHNREEWDQQWKNRQLLIRNPLTCNTMTVDILDTCEDDDCPDPLGQGPGCCTAHANENGGHLVDLEYFTSVRFWGAPIGVDEVRRLEFQVI